MISYADSDDDKTNEELSIPLKREDMVLIVLEDLVVHMG